MLNVSATELCDHLFDYLERAAAGEIIIIQRNNQPVARLMPLQQTDWRERMTDTPRLLVTPEELCQPLDYLWEAFA